MCLLKRAVVEHPLGVQLTGGCHITLVILLLHCAYRSCQSLLCVHTCASWELLSSVLVLTYVRTWGQESQPKKLSDISSRAIVMEPKICVGIGDPTHSITARQTLETSHYLPPPVTVFIKKCWKRWWKGKGVLWWPHPLLSAWVVRFQLVSEWLVTISWAQDSKFSSVRSEKSMFHVFLDHKILAQCPRRQSVTGWDQAPRVMLGK